MSGINGPTGLDQPLDIEVVSGVEGPSIYLNGFRVAGTKPWGGGSYVYRLKTTGRDVLHGLVGRPNLPHEKGPEDAMEWHHWYRRRETPALMESLSELAQEVLDAERV